MTSKSRMLSRMRELCAELGPEDGIDPRELKRQRAKEARKSSHRKTAQLCGQVARTLNLSLGASSDPLLQQMIVADGTEDEEKRREYLMALSRVYADLGEFDKADAARAEARRR